MGTGAISFDVDAVVEGRARLTDAQALELYQNASLHDLGQWASAVTRRLHPGDERTYVIDRNINYTNVCTAKCTFCAFRRDHEDADSYTLDYDTIGAKIREKLIRERYEWFREKFKGREFTPGDGMN